MQNKTDRNIVEDLLKEMVKKRLTEQEKIDIILPVITENPELININSGNEKYNKANLVFNSLIFCPALFDIISNNKNFLIDYKSLNQYQESLLFPAIVYQPQYYQMIKNNINDESYMRLNSQRTNTNSFGFSENLLETALQSENLEIAQDIIDNNQSIEGLSYDTYGALASSIINAKSHILSFLLKNGVDANTELEHHHYDNLYTELKLSDLINYDFLNIHRKNVLEMENMLSETLKNIDILNEYKHDFSHLKKYTKSTFYNKFKEPQVYQRIKACGFSLPDDAEEDILIFNQLYSYNSEEFKVLEQFDVNLNSKINEYGIFSFMISHIISTSGYMGANITPELNGINYLLDLGIYPFDKLYKDTFSEVYGESDYLIEQINDKDSLSLLYDQSRQHYLNAYDFFRNILKNHPGDSFLRDEMNTVYCERDLLKLAQYHEKILSKIKSEFFEDLHLNSQTLYNNLSKCYKHFDNREFRNIGNNIYLSLIPTNHRLYVSELLETEGEYEVAEAYLLSGRDKAIEWFKRSLVDKISNQQFKDGQISFTQGEIKALDILSFTPEENISMYNEAINKLEKRSKQMSHKNDVYIEGINTLKTKVSEIEKNILNTIINPIKAQSKVNRI